VGVGEGAAERLSVDSAVLEQRLGERDHHLGVVGVGAAPKASIHHLDPLRDFPRRPALERHSERVADERAEQRPAGAIDVRGDGHDERMPQVAAGPTNPPRSRGWISVPRACAG
jgi:hypothetical protein